MMDLSDEINSFSHYVNYMLIILAHEYFKISFRMFPKKVFFSIFQEFEVFVSAILYFCVNNESS